MGRWPFLFVLCACAVPLPATAPDAPRKDSDVELERAWAMPGETMEFSASIRGLPVGRVVTAIGRPGWIDGRHALIVRSRGQSTGMIALLAELTWEQTTTVDLDRGFAIHAVEETTANLPGHDAEHEERTIGDDAQHDLHSAVAAVRAWRSQPGDRAHLRVRFGSASLAVTLTDAGHAYLPSAHEPAVRYDGVFDESFHFTAWVSDDVARVPLRFEAELDGDIHIGRLVVDLVHYDAGTLTE